MQIRAVGMLGRVRRAAVLAVSVIIASAVGTVVFAAGAQADAIYCGESNYIQEIKKADWVIDGKPAFQIIIYPKIEARVHAGLGVATRMPNERPVVVDEWHAIQACIRGLYDGLADSIWQQLECHQKLSWAWNPARNNWQGDWATGPTYDLESWRPPIPFANIATEAATNCLNWLGEREDSQVVNPFRPDTGQTDLQHAYDNIA